MKNFRKLITLCLALMLCLSCASAAFAAEVADATIDEDALCSLTIWKFDFTNAMKDGVWNEDSFISTGWRESYVEEVLGEAVRKGDANGETDNPLGNGQNSNGYAIKGVEFSYLRVADIVTFTESANDQHPDYNLTQVLYGFDKVKAADLLKAIGLADGAGRYENADNTDKLSHSNYSFQDQLLIHAQRPDATACAEIDTWNKLGRWVNKGTRGIALLVDRDVPYKLRYVFDLSDTNSRAGREVQIWQMRERYLPDVQEALSNSFGEVDASRDFPVFLMEVAENAVSDNLDDYAAALENVKRGSLLEELDDLNTRQWLRQTLCSSVGFMLLTRCGYDAAEHFSFEDFAHVLDFNTHDTQRLRKDSSCTALQPL